MQAIDQKKSEAFAEKLLATINGAALTLMVSVGHRTRLFDAMDGAGPLTSARLAERAGLSERYVREWLGAMATGGIVEHDHAAGTYTLPAEHAAWLTRAASPNNMAVTAQWIAVLGAVETKVVDAFGHGRGVPYEAYDRFSEVMAEESGQTTVAALEEHIIPLVPGLRTGLERGIDVLDVGCGAGRAMLTLAERFPRSRFVGYDFLPGPIAAAQAEAARRGLTNVRFERLDVAEMEDRERFDLITTFDAVHDQADPARVLANIRRALRPGGVYLMQEIAGSSCVHLNMGKPLGPFTYTISCMHCMSVSLANNGAGLGAAWGKELALEMLAQAGFGDVRVERLPHDIINEYYVVRPGGVEAPHTGRLAAVGAC